MRFTSPWLLIPLFLASMAIVLALVPPLRALLKLAGLVDKPSARRINKKPIPRGGGLAIFAAVMAVSAAWHAMTGIYAPWASPAQYKMSVIAASVIVLVGLLDDALDLKPFLKLAGQIVAFLVLYFSGISVGTALWFDIPPLIDLGLTLVWYIIIVNAFNLIDGMDGLASGLALIGALGLTLCLMCRHVAYMAVPLAILGGACLGFLRYNFNPASVFLGDCGSMFIGLVLATIPLLTGGKSAFLASILSPLLVIGVPIFDTTLAIWRRSMRATIPDGAGRHDFSRIMRPDMDHLHHRLLATGITQRRAAWSLYMLSIAMVLVAVGISFYADRSAGIILVGSIFIVAIMVRHLSRVELWDTGQAFLSMYATPKFAKMLIPMYLALDIAFLIAAWHLSFVFAFPYDVPHRLVTVFPLFLTCHMAMMFLMAIYRRIWSRANARDFAVLFLCIVGGWLAAVSISIITGIRYPGFNRQVVIFFLMSSLPIMAMRCIRILVAHFLEASETIRLSTSAASTRYLAYGAGDTFAAYDAAMRGTIIGHREGFVAALIDDDPMLKGRLMHGHRVLGNSDEIDRIVNENKITCLLITCALTPENREKALAAAARLGIDVHEWRGGVFDVEVPKAQPLKVAAADNR